VDLVGLLISKMLDLGADYPLFTRDTLDGNSHFVFALGDLSGRNSDIFEGQ